MDIKKIILILSAFLGTSVGFYVGARIIMYTKSADFSIVFTYLEEFFKVDGMGYKGVLTLIASTLFGAMLFVLMAILILVRSQRRRLNGIYAAFEPKARFLVAQKTKEAYLIALFFLALAAAALYAFLMIYKAGTQDVSLGYGTEELTTVRFHYLKFAITVSIAVSASVGAMIVLYASLLYGPYRRIPIRIGKESIGFFKTCYRLPVIAIDKPTQVGLANAEIDFDSGSSKGSLYVSDGVGRVVISPRLEFINGSFDELADYLEKQIAIEEPA